MCNESSLPEDLRLRTLERFEELRKAWEHNEALRMLYADWYRRMAHALPDASLGPWVEIGSGPGFAREFLPQVELTDVVKASWHDRQVSAESLPYAANQVGAFLLLDVLHHVASPMRFFSEAVRALQPGGRVIVCEPYLSALSYPVYRFLHPEPVVLRCDPFADHPSGTKDPWDSNQALPTVLFSARRRDEWNQRLPQLRVVRIDHLAGLSYPLTGGFSGRRLLPLRLWKKFYRMEETVVPHLHRLLAFRMLVILEKTP